MTKIDVDSGWYRFQIEGEVKQEKLAVVITAGVASVVYRGSVLSKTREITGAKAKLEESQPYDAAKGKSAADIIQKALDEFGSFNVYVVEASDRGQAKDSGKPTEADIESAKRVVADEKKQDQLIKHCAKYSVADPENMEDVMDVAKSVRLVRLAIDRANRATPQSLGL